METITFTIPLTIESVTFINQALAGAKLAGFDTAEYEKANRTRRFTEHVGGVD